MIRAPGATIFIYQPNRLTDARFNGFGLLHLRIFNAVLKQLQPHMLANINGTSPAKEIAIMCGTKSFIPLPIFLKDITTPNHYPQAIRAAADMMALSIRTGQRTPPNGQVALKNIFNGVGSLQKVGGAAMIYVHVSQQTVESLTALDRNGDGKAINFTSFNYGLAMAIRSKHALRLYILISSWKNKGGFHIALGDLKEILGIGTGYGNFSVFRKEILLPAQRELEKLGDCWFNTSDPTFRKMKGSRVTGLNFKVITKKSGQLLLQKTQQLEHILRLHGGFRDGDLKPLRPLFVQTADLNALIVKAIYLVGKRTDGNGQAITDRVAYISKALLETLSTE